MTDTVTENVSDLVKVVRELGSALRPAVAARWEAPPQAARSMGEGNMQGVGNPTLETVLDPRRLALSQEVAETSRDLARAVHLLRPHVDRLHLAVARWEGEDPTP